MGPWRVSCGWPTLVLAAALTLLAATAPPALSDAGEHAAGGGGEAPPQQHHHRARHHEQQVAEEGAHTADSLGGGGGGKVTPADRALWQWLRDGGAVLHFEPGYSPDGVRGGYATSDIPANGLVASIPTKLTFKFPAKWKSFVALGEQLALEHKKGDSFYRPYFDSMPTLSDAGYTLSWESFPPQYLHLLQAAAPLVERIVSMQSATLRYWARHGLRLSEKGVGLDDLRAALLTITTRWYTGPSDGPDAGHMALIPAYDLLNHHNGCPVHYDFGPCAAPGQDPTGTCVAVRSSAPIPRGGEVCNSYNHLTPDLALFHYGFELPEEAAGPSPGARGAARKPGEAAGEGGTAASASESAAEEAAGAASAMAAVGEGASEGGKLAAAEATAAAARPVGAGSELNTIDAHGFSAADLRHAHESAPVPFMGSLSELQVERDRLQAILTILQERAPAAEATRPAPGDPGGEKLAMLLSWRRRRARALAAEVERLGAEIRAAEAVMAAGAGGGGDGAAASGAGGGRDGASAAAVAGAEAGGGPPLRKGTGGEL